MSASSTTAKMKSRRTHTVQTLLSQYKLDKQSSSDKADTHTNTRIGSKDAKIHGGTYVIPDSEYSEFMNKIKTATLNGQYEYLTEKQLVEGPLAIDMDLHYDYEVEDRQHNKSHIDDLIDVIFESLFAKKSDALKSLEVLKSSLRIFSITSSTLFLSIPNGIDSISINSFLTIISKPIDLNSSIILLYSNNCFFVKLNSIGKTNF